MIFSIHIVTSAPISILADIIKLILHRVPQNPIQYVDILISVCGPPCGGRRFGCGYSVLWYTEVWKLVTCSAGVQQLHWTLDGFTIKWPAHGN